MHAEISRRVARALREVPAGDEKKWEERKILLKTEVEECKRIYQQKRDSFRSKTSRHSSKLANVTKDIVAYWESYDSSQDSAKSTDLKIYGQTSRSPNEDLKILIEKDVHCASRPSSGKRECTNDRKSSTVSIKPTLEKQTVKEDKNIGYAAFFSNDMTTKDYKGITDTHTKKNLTRDLTKKIKTCTKRLEEEPNRLTTTKHTSIPACSLQALRDSDIPQDTHRQIDKKESHKDTRKARFHPAAETHRVTEGKSVGYAAFYSNLEFTYSNQKEAPSKKEPNTSVKKSPTVNQKKGKKNVCCASIDRPVKIVKKTFDNNGSEAIKHIEMDKGKTLSGSDEIQTTSKQISASHQVIKHQAPTMSAINIPDDSQASTETIASTKKQSTTNQKKSKNNVCHTSVDRSVKVNKKPCESNGNEVVEHIKLVKGKPLTGSDKLQTGHKQRIPSDQVIEHQVPVINFPEKAQPDKEPIARAKRPSTVSQEANKKNMLHASVDRPVKVDNKICEGNVIEAVEHIELEEGTPLFGYNEIHAGNRQTSTSNKVIDHQIMKTSVINIPENVQTPSKTANSYTSSRTYLANDGPAASSKDRNNRRNRHEYINYPELCKTIPLNNDIPADGLKSSKGRHIDENNTHKAMSPSCPTLITAEYPPTKGRSFSLPDLSQSVCPNATDRSAMTPDVFSVPEVIDRKIIRTTSSIATFHLPQDAKSPNGFHRGQFAPEQAIYILNVDEERSGNTKCLYQIKKGLPRNASLRSLSVAIDTSIKGDIKQTSSVPDLRQVNNTKENGPLPGSDLFSVPDVIERSILRSSSSMASFCLNGWDLPGCTARDKHLLKRMQTPSCPILTPISTWRDITPVRSHSLPDLSSLIPMEMFDVSPLGSDVFSVPEVIERVITRTASSHAALFNLREENRAFKRPDSPKSPNAIKKMTAIKGRSMSCDALQQTHLIKTKKRASSCAAISCNMDDSQVEADKINEMPQLPPEIIISWDFASDTTGENISEDSAKMNQMSLANYTTVITPRQSQVSKNKSSVRPVFTPPEDIPAPTQRSMNRTIFTPPEDIMCVEYIPSPGQNQTGKASLKSNSNNSTVLDFNCEFSKGEPAQREISTQTEITGKYKRIVKVVAVRNPAPESSLKSLREEVLQQDKEEVNCGDQATPDEQGSTKLLTVMHRSKHRIPGKRRIINDPFLEMKTHAQSSSLISEEYSLTRNIKKAMRFIVTGSRRPLTKPVIRTFNRVMKDKSIVTVKALIIPHPQKGWKLQRMYTPESLSEAVLRKNHEKHLKEAEILNHSTISEVHGIRKLSEIQDKVDGTTARKAAKSRRFKVKKPTMKTFRITKNETTITGKALILPYPQKGWPITSVLPSVSLWKELLKIKHQRWLEARKTSPWVDLPLSGCSDVISSIIDDGVETTHLLGNMTNQPGIPLSATTSPDPSPDTERAWLVPSPDTEKHLLASSSDREQLFAQFPDTKKLHSNQSSYKNELLLESPTQNNEQLMAAYPESDKHMLVSCSGNDMSCLVTSLRNENRQLAPSPDDEKSLLNISANSMGHPSPCQKMCGETEKDAFAYKCHIPRPPSGCPDRPRRLPHGLKMADIESLKHYILLPDIIRPPSSQHPESHKQQAIEADKNLASDTEQLMHNHPLPEITTSGTQKNNSSRRTKSPDLNARNIKHFIPLPDIPTAKNSRGHMEKKPEDHDTTPNYHKLSCPLTGFHASDSKHQPSRIPCLASRNGRATNTETITPLPDKQTARKDATDLGAHEEYKQEHRVSSPKHINPYSPLPGIQASDSKRPSSRIPRPATGLYPYKPLPGILASDSKRPSSHIPHTASRDGRATSLKTIGQKYKKSQIPHLSTVMPFIPTREDRKLAFLLQGSRIPHKEVMQSIQDNHNSKIKHVNIENPDTQRPASVTQNISAQNKAILSTLSPKMSEQHKHGTDIKTNDSTLRTTSPKELGKESKPVTKTKAKHKNLRTTSPKDPRNSTRGTETQETQQILRMTSLKKTGKSKLGTETKERYQTNRNTEVKRPSKPYRNWLEQPKWKI